MKLAYITNARIPAERANAVQTIQMCAAFAAAGVNLTLYHPNRRTIEIGEADLWAYYGVPRAFARQPVACLDLFHLSPGQMWIERPIFFLQTLTFALALIGALWRAPADWYYSRDPIVLALMTLLMPAACARMIFEAHTFPTTALGRRFRRWALNRIGGTVAISHALEKLYRELGVSKIMTAPDGVDLNRFAVTDSRAALRARLGLPLAGPLIVYTGGLYAGRGLEEMIQAVNGLAATLVIVGGKDQAALERLQHFARAAGVTNVCFVGYRPPTEIPLYLAAADILAMPYSRRTLAPGGITTDYMSPLKMFEYMAAARPIVASDLPALREVLNSNNALLIPPDDAPALAAALARLLADPALAGWLADQARRDAAAYTWAARAQHILAFSRESHHA